MKKLLYAFLAILMVAGVMLTASPAQIARAASLVQVTGFGTNPTGLQMYLYVPASVTAHPAILVAIHYCTGSGPAFFSGTEFASLADRYGFIVIYPSATRNGACFDVSSPQALTHNGGSDPVGIVSMVTYVESHNNGDSSRVYVTGASSGAMMTNVMIGDYPDVFKAGAAFMGVPDTCFSTTSGGDPTNPANQAGWNSACATGTISKTAQQWGDLARGSFPGYTGARPRMQLWHGTADPTLNYNNFGEEIKQWTNVLGVSQTPTFTDTPQSGWTRTRYGSSGIGGPVEGISVAGAGHVLPLSGQAAMAIQFFGLDGTVVPTNTPVRTNTPTNTPVGPTPTRTNTPTGPTVTPIPGTISINAGGAATGSFLADQDFSGGTTFTNTATIDMSQITSNPPPAAIFNSERYGAMTYTIPNISGAQTVTLYFAETFLTAAGQRLFNVTINGTTVLSSFDIFAAAGGQNKAIARTFSTTANNGQVVIQFITGTENPKINGITVVAGGSGPTNTPIGPTVTPTRTPTPTNTPLGPSATPTATPIGPTPTTVSGGTCSPVTATITAPFTQDGAGTFCWQTSSLGAYINSWNTTSVTINGVNITNLYMASGSYPAKINGFWYITYTSTVAWGHFETK